jgi:hypothetical protein
MVNSSATPRAERLAQVGLGISFIACTIATILIVAGGAERLRDLIDLLTSGEELAPLTKRSIAYLALGWITVVGIGIYLIVVPAPSRSGWWISTVLIGVVLVLDFVMLEPQSPVRVPAVMSHAGLLLLIAGVGRWRSTRQRGRGRS